ncbi:MAG: hypothetical protein RLY43_1059, partial [Bacteroidota bacterium]
VYIFFWQISPPAARLAWYFLPIVLFKGFELIEILPSIHQKFYYGLIVLMTLSSACYGLFITHDNFWIGTYE